MNWGCAAHEPRWPDSRSTNSSKLGDPRERLGSPDSDACDRARRSERTEEYINPHTSPSFFIQLATNSTTTTSISTKPVDMACNCQSNCK